MKGNCSNLFSEDDALFSSTLLHDVRISFKICIIKHGAAWNDVQDATEAFEESEAEKLDSRAEDSRLA